MPRTQDEVAQSTESRSASSTSGSSASSSSTSANSSTTVRPSPPSSDAHPGSLPLSSNHPSAVCVEVPLEIHGSRRSNVQGQPAEPFNEETFSVIVFPHGGIVRLEAAVIAGQMLAVTNRNSQRGILCRVTNVRNYPKLKSYVEIVFSQPAPGFWGVRFPDEGHAHFQPAETSEPQQAAQPSAQKPASQPQLQAPRALPPSPAHKATEPASTKLEKAAASLKNLAAELAVTIVPPPIEASVAPIEEAAAVPEIAVPEVIQSESAEFADSDDESTAVIELADEPETELSDLVEALQEDSELNAEPQAAATVEAVVESHAAPEFDPVVEPEIDRVAEPEVTAATEPEVVAQAASPAAEPLKDDFWSTSFPEEILNWAIETAAIPPPQEAPAKKPAVTAPVEKQKSSAPPQQSTKSVGFAAPPASKAPAAKQISKQPAQPPQAAQPVQQPQPAQLAASISPAQPKPAQPSATEQLNDRDLREPAPEKRRPSLWQKQAQQPTQQQQAAPPAKQIVAKQSAPPELDIPEPGIDEDSDPILESGMRQELERLALSHLNPEEDEISPEDDAKSIISAPAPSARTRHDSPAQQPSRPSKADRKALAARGRTRYNSATSLIPSVTDTHDAPEAHNSTDTRTARAAKTAVARSRHAEPEPDSIIVDENTAVLLRPMKDGIPLGPLLGATQEYDAASVTQLTQGTSKRANMLVVGVAVVMLAVVGGGWWFFHHDATPARALPEPTGPVNSQPQPAGSYNQPAQPANTHVDPMDAAAAAALKAGANTTPADAIATSAPAHLMNPASQPAASQPAASQPTSQPINSQPANSQPATSQPAPTKPSASRPAASQPLPTQPAASPPVASASPTARARESSPLPHEEDSETRPSSSNYTHKLLMPAVKLSAPKVEGRSASSSDTSAPAIVDHGNASGAPAPGINGIVPNADASMPAPSAPVHTGISTVGGRVREPKLVARVTPTYPPEARQFNIQGTVTIDATIDPHGNVIGMRVVSGPAALQRAAMDALKEWKYEPSTLNDRPVSVHTIVTIKFTR